MASPPRFCPHCGAPVDERGVYRHRHIPLVGRLAPERGEEDDLFPTPSIAEALRLSWRMVSSQWSVLWLPVIAFATGLAWDLIFILLFGASLGAGEGFSFGPLPWSFGTMPWHMEFWHMVPWHIYPWQMMPFEIAPAQAWAMALGLVRLITAWVLLPYLEAGLVGGIIRAVAEEAAPLEFWADGFRYLGRSYLAIIGSVIVVIVGIAIGGIWSLVFLGMLGPVVGGLIAALGDAAVFAFALPALALVYVGIYQSGWDGFGRALHIVRRHLGAMLLLVLCFSALFLAVSAFGYGIVVLLYRLFPSLMAPVFAGPILGLGIPWLFSWVVSVFVMGGLVIYYRRASGMELGLWAPAHLRV